MFKVTFVVLMKLMLNEVVKHPGLTESCNYLLEHCPGGWGVLDGALRKIGLWKLIFCCCKFNLVELIGSSLFHMCTQPYDDNVKGSVLVFL